MSVDASKIRPGDISKELALGLNRPDNSFLSVGVVEEIIFLPNNFEYSAFYDRINEPKVLNDVPANSLLVRVITGKEYKNTGNLLLCYPFFPQHLQLPIKVGEHVFFIKYGKIGYWLSRVPDSHSVEDTNYSHGDRKYLQITDEISIIEKAKNISKAKKNFIGIFNNGGESNDNQTFLPNDSYSKIINDSSTNNSVTKEPVPIFIKRPGDTVFQGSNNTLIILGQSRGWTKLDTDFKVSNALYSGQKNNEGSIDIIVGRGRYIPDRPTTENEIGSEPIRTGPRTIINEYGLIEADRMSFMNSIPFNPIEGDPDYEYDAGRFKLALKENIDELFFLTKDTNNNYILPKITSWPEGLNSLKNIEPINDSSYAIMKSDEIRIIARRQEENVNGLKSGISEINGSIKIIKEGIQNSEEGDGKAVIIMQPDGTIMIDGPTIVIGSGDKSLEKSHGEGTHIILGSEAKEPIVLGNTLKDLLEAHFNDIKLHIDDLKLFLKSIFDTHIHPTGVGPSGPPTVPALQMESKIDNTKTNIDKSINDLITILSKYGKIK